MKNSKRTSNSTYKRSQRDMLMLMGISKNSVGFLEMPDEYFLISLYIVMTYQKTSQNKSKENL